MTCIRGGIVHCPHNSVSRIDELRVFKQCFLKVLSIGQGLYNALMISPLSVFACEGMSPWEGSCVRTRAKPKVLFHFQFLGHEIRFRLSSLTIWSPTCFLVKKIKNSSSAFTKKNREGEARGAFSWPTPNNRPVASVPWLKDIFFLAVAIGSTVPFQSSPVKVPNVSSRQNFIDQTNHT